MELKKLLLGTAGLGLFSASLLSNVYNEYLNRNFSFLFIALTSITTVAFIVLVLKEILKPNAPISNRNYLRAGSIIIFLVWVGFIYFDGFVQDFYAYFKKITLYEGKYVRLLVDKTPEPLSSINILIITNCAIPCKILKAELVQSNGETANEIFRSAGFSFKERKDKFDNEKNVSHFSTVIQLKQNFNIDEAKIHLTVEGAKLATEKHFTTNTQTITLPFKKRAA